jgi:hypothetical protein
LLAGAAITTGGAMSAHDSTTFDAALAGVEADLKCERLFGYLQDDVTKKRPTVDLILRLLCPTLPDQVAARSLFSIGATLIRWELITLGDDAGPQQRVLRSRHLKLDERIAASLLGQDAIDSRLAPLVSRAPLHKHLNAGVREQLEQWASNWSSGTGATTGRPPCGTGRRAAAAGLAAALGRPCLLLDFSRYAGTSADVKRTIRLAEREPLLTGALMCLFQETGFFITIPRASRNKTRSCMRSPAVRWRQY